MLEYLPLGSEFKKQTSIAEKQYQNLDDNVRGHDITVLIKKKESCNLLYNNFKFEKFNISDEEFDELSKDTIYKHLDTFFIRINEFKKLKPRNNEKKEEKAVAGDKVSELRNKRISNQN